MPTITVGEVELYYEIEGAGTDTVAFVNGIAMTVQSWEPMRTHFAAAGFRCLLHDCRGQLRSAKPTDCSYSMEQHAEDLVELLDALSIEQVHLVGTSYGSEIAMVFAYTYPERVASLTVIAGVSELDSLMRAAAESWAAAGDCGGVPFFRCMLPWAYSNGYLSENQSLLREREEAMAALPAEYFVAFRRLVEAFLRLDITAHLARIACPTLVISAERDLLKGPRFGQLIHDNLVNSEFSVVPDAGHAVVLEQPDLVAKQTIEFIDRQRRAQ